MSTNRKAVLALLIGVGVILAQSAGSGASAGTGTAVPAGFTVLPANDFDRADDQILQLNNLTIQSISGSVPGTIYASQGIGGCREYMSVDGAGSRIYPCPLAPSILYEISVQSDTILLLKNRSRASISDFAVGDHINVFGFIDPGTSYVQALIVRDLDKPATAQYVQMNNLTIISGPGAATPPTAFVAAHRGFEPCFAFGSAAAPRGIPYPCPLGTQASALTGTAASLTAANPEFYEPYRQYYTVQVTPATQLLNLYRRPLSLGEMQAGDQVNVYGRYNPGTRAIEALIMRDLSVPRSTPPPVPLPPSAPFISSIRPASGTYATQVTLRGKFARTGNYVYMSGYNAVNDLRSDGATLTFTVPEYVGVCPYNPYDVPREPVACTTLALQLPAGRNPVHVVNANGTSNSVDFIIESR